MWMFYLLFFWMIIRNCKYLVSPSIDVLEGEKKLKNRDNLFFILVYRYLKSKRNGSDSQCHRGIKYCLFCYITFRKLWKHQKCRSFFKTNQNDCTSTTWKKNRYSIRRIAGIWPTNATMRKQQKEKYYVTNVDDNDDEAKKEETVPLCCPSDLSIAYLPQNDQLILSFLHQTVCRRPNEKLSERVKRNWMLICSCISLKLFHR